MPIKENISDGKQDRSSPLLSKDRAVSRFFSFLLLMTLLTLAEDAHAKEPRPDFIYGPPPSSALVNLESHPVVIPEATSQPIVKPTMPTQEAQPHINQPLIISHGSRAEKKVALTLDDGWSDASVRLALEIGKQYGVTFTFCPVGKMVKANPTLWREAVAQGHELCNHTMNHTWLTNLSDEKIREQLATWQSTVDAALGYHYPTRYFRPPGMAGFTSAQGDPRIKRVIYEFGLDVLMWDVDSGSTRFYGEIDAAGVKNAVLANTRNGSIVLQHFIPTDLGALPEIIARLHAQGMDLVTASQLNLK